MQLNSNTSCGTCLTSTIGNNSTTAAAATASLANNFNEGVSTKKVKFVRFFLEETKKTLSIEMVRHVDQ